eukprot:jgi/Astpho2/3244/Aster-05765
MQDLHGKTVLITGATNGIGRETAFAMASLGATVVLGCRNIDAARDIIFQIKEKHPSAELLIPAKLDLAEPASIRAFAKAYRAQNLSCHILINNAGATNLKEFFTSEGVYGLPQVNYQGPYELTRLLEPVLIQCAPSRVVNLSSIMHRFTFIKNDPATFLKQRRGEPYPATKLANVLFTYELQRRLEQHGVQACAVDPGGVNSNIWQNSIFAKPPLKWLLGAVFAPNSDAAKVVVHAATDPWQPPRASADGNGKEDRSRFRFYARGTFTSPVITSFRYDSGLVGKAKFQILSIPVAILSALDYPLRWMSGGLLASRPRLVKSSPHSYNAELAAKLWDLSAETGGLSKDPILK